MRKHRIRSQGWLLAGAGLLFANSPAGAQETGAAQASNADELAKKLSNPIAALISVPSQYNTTKPSATTAPGTR